jgi:hypothetical protein
MNKEQLEQLAIELQQNIDQGQVDVVDFKNKLQDTKAKIEAIGKITVPRDLLTRIIHSCASQVEQSLGDISAGDVEVELSMNYDNTVEVDAIDLCNVDLCVEDILMAEFEDVFNVTDGPIPGAYEIAK